MSRTPKKPPAKGGVINRHLSNQRRWRLLLKLQGARFGLSPSRLLELLEDEGLNPKLVPSRATLYRDLDILEGSGFLVKEEGERGSEKRYHLQAGVKVSPMPPTREQTLAMRLARRLLAPLEGTRILYELDALLPRSSPAAEEAEARPTFAFPPPHRFGESALVRSVERAIEDKKRLTFMYEPKHGDCAERTVDPLTFLVRDDHLYLAAFDLEREGIRTFKIARMRDACVLDEAAAPHPDYDGKSVFKHAAKIWSGPLVEVVVRIQPGAARFASEWPLIPDQTLEPLADGAVLVRAEVHGVIEAMRWVLRWGQEAQVLSPPELRAAVVAELLGAIQAYTSAPVSHS